MKRILFLLAFSFLVLLPICTQASPSVFEKNKEEVQLNILANDYSVLGKSVLFSAKLENLNLSEEYLEFVWDFGNQQYVSGNNVSHVFSEIGDYEINLIVKDRENNLLATTTHNIKVGKEIIFLISDVNYPDDNLNTLTRLLKTQGNLVFNIIYKEKDLLFIENLINYYPTEQSSSFILLSNELSFYNNLFNTIQDEAQILNLIKSKPFVLVNEGQIVRSLADNLKNLIEAPYIILLEDVNILPNIYKNGSGNLLNNLYQEGGEYEVIGVSNKSLPWYRVMLRATNEMVQHGIPLENIWIILSLTLIATIVVFSRQVIGLKIIGIYMPTLLALSFIMTGLLQGVIFLSIIFIVSILTRLLTKKTRILYMPKLALLIIFVSLSVFIAMFALSYGGYVSFSNYSIVPIVILILLSEKFLSIHFEYSRKRAWYITFETILLAVIAYLIVNWQTLRLLVLAYPEIVLLTIPINIFLGKWTGLRLLEYSRFAKVIAQESEEDYSDLEIKI